MPGEIEEIEEIEEEYRELNVGSTILFSTPNMYPTTFCEGKIVSIDVSKQLVEVSFIIQFDCIQGIVEIDEVSNKEDKATAPTAETVP